MVSLSIVVLPKVLGCGVMTVTNGGVYQFHLQNRLMKTADGIYFSHSSSHICQLCHNCIFFFLCV